MKRCGKMRKEHIKREKMGKETIMYWKSANDIIVVNYSVHSNDQNEYMQIIDIVGLAPVLFFQDSIMHLIAINQGPALPNYFLAQKYMII